MAVQMGIDLFCIQRMEQAWQRKDPCYFSSIFSPRENEVGCAADQPILWFAQRLALKEAAFKSLGTLWTSEMEWNQIEALSTSFGAPIIVLSGAMKRAAEQAGITHFSASVSSDGGFVIAVVAAEKPCI
jgi:holo-[acyl-carrier protein] synthase